MNIKVKMKSFNQIASRLGVDENGDVTKFLRNDCDRYMDSYIPMDSGNLKKTKTYPSNHEIKYTSPYAHYMYKGVVYISPTLGVSGIPIKTKKGIKWWSPKGEKKIPTSRAIKYQGGSKRGKEWDKRMKNDRKADIVRDVQNYLKRK